MSPPSFSIRIVDLDQDYSMLEQWWSGHQFPPIPANLLPKLGVIVCHKDTPTAAAWCYLDSSTPVAMIEWIVTNPDATPRSIPTAIGHALTFLKEQAKEFGYSALLATCKQPGLSRILQRHDFEVTDSTIIHHIHTL